MYVIRSGSTYKIVDDKDIEVVDTLPIKTYSVSQNPQTMEFYLEEIDDFKLPGKLYGSIEKKALRVINTFNDRPLGTGVHLNGVKGSGKTLLAKAISIFAKKHNIPTIIVNKNFNGDEFNKFIQKIDCECVIIFDEFEKTYQWNDQDKILTLFDGVFPTKKLFILTTNEVSAVNRYLNNRPGRIFYSFEFNTLEEEFVREYLEDNLNDKSQIDIIIKYSKTYSFFTFDMLAACTEEMNRYNETFVEVIEVLNVHPENIPNDLYTLVAKFPSLNYEYTIDKSVSNFIASKFSYDVYIEDIPFVDIAEVEKQKYVKLYYDTDGGFTIDAQHLISMNPIKYQIERNGHVIEFVLEKNKSYTFSNEFLLA